MERFKRCLKLKKASSKTGSMDNKFGKCCIIQSQPGFLNARHLKSLYSASGPCESPRTTYNIQHFLNLFVYKTFLCRTLTGLKVLEHALGVAALYQLCLCQHYS